MSATRRRTRKPRAPCLCLGGCQQRKPSTRVDALLDPIRASWEGATGLPIPEGRFRCPMCLREVQAFCATLAHAPAAAVGGRVVGLQCKKCNDFIGHSYEAVATREAQHMAGEAVIGVGAPGRPARVKVRAKFEDDPDDKRHHHIYLSPAGSQRDYDQALKHLSAIGGIGGFAIGPMSPGGPVGAQVAWAYLLWFEKFGFSFALSPSLRRVRKALLEGDIDDLGRSPVFYPGPRTGSWERGEAGVVMVEDEGGGVLALGWAWESAIVALPVPADGDAAVYDRLDDMVEDAVSLDVTFSRLEFREPVRFGLPPEPSASKGPVKARFAGMLIVGASDDEMKSVAAEPVTPTQPRRTPRPALPRPNVPPLLESVGTESWTAVAVQEARRVALDPEAVDDRVLTAINDLGTLGTDVEAAIASLQGLLDPATVGHLSDLRRYALLKESYDASTDRSSMRAVLWAADHAVRSVPKTHRPHVADLRVEHYPGVRLGRAFAVIEDTHQHRLELIGPFYTGRTLLAALRLRMKRLRADVKRTGREP